MTEDMKMDYIIIKANEEELAEEVKNKIKDGYKPFGAPVYTGYGYYVEGKVEGRMVSVFLQVMVKGPI